MKSEKKVKKFLKEINPKDRIALLVHDDFDGFVSGMFLYDFCKKKKCKNIEVFIFKINKTKIKKGELNKFNKILITDIEPIFLKEIFRNCRDKKVLYIDHHEKSLQCPKHILEYRNKKISSASKIINDLFLGEKNDKEFLEISSQITDSGFKFKENLSMLEPFLRKYKFNLEQLKDKLFKVPYFMRYFESKNKLKKAFEIFKDIKTIDDVKRVERYSDKIEKEIDLLVDKYKIEKEKFGKINFFYFKSKFKITSFSLDKIGDKKPDDVFIFATPIEDRIRLSVRSQNTNTNMVKLLKKVTKDMKGTSIGGHMHTAGGTIVRKDLKKFKENLKRVF